jgi:hypothetical protein
MIGKYKGDVLKKSMAGQEYLVSVFEVDGKDKNFSKSKKFTDKLEIGNIYNLETWQGEGKKTIYINKAIEQTVKVEPKKEIVKVDKSKVDVNLQTDKMTKEDWNRKDDGIKWLTCLKASADFHARREESTIKDVIGDARELYKATPTTNGKDVFDNIPDSF